ncbi:MAG: trypsin-like peptidase domain-containing protein [Planctomycetaceae bacterium]|jgi:serine protease Do|nr:trypsin-like peptidase domain-containing protein [Planctomycetaceae bacterium]
MIRYSISVVFILVLVVPAVSRTVEYLSEEYYQRLEEANRGVVSIEGNKIGDRNYSDPNDYGKAFTGMGSGIIIDPKGYIVTNQHVMEGLTKIVVTLYDGTKYAGTYIGHDPETDIALIKIEPKVPLYPIPIGSSAYLRKGERINAIGNPFGYSFSLTEGIVSYIGRDVVASPTLTYRRTIQISAPINPGNSGGPVVNQNGEAVALNVCIYSEAQGIAFAVPIETVLSVGSKLIGKQNNRFCYHGISVETQETLPHDERVLVVSSVDAGSPAEEAGIVPGDEIEMINGQLVASEFDFQRAFLEKTASETIDITVQKTNERMDLSLTLRSPNTRMAGTTSVRNARNNQPRVIASRQSYPNPQTVSPNEKEPLPEPTYEDVVWNTFGLKVTPVSSDFLKNSFPAAYQAYPRGAVKINAMKTTSFFYRSGIQEEDFIAGIMVGSDTDGWSIVNAANLSYIAKYWNPQTLGAEYADVHVIRKNGEITIKKVPILNNTVIASKPKATR